MFDIFDNDIFDNDIQLVENEEIPLQKKRKIVTRIMAKYSKKPSEIIALANSLKNKLNDSSSSEKKPEEGVNELLIRRHQETDKNYRKAERRVKKVTFKIENKNKEDIDEDGSIKIKLEERIRALEEDLNGEQLRNSLLESKLNKEMEKKKKYKKLLKQKENEMPSTSIAVPTVPMKLKDFKPLLPLN
uniref:Uncharacterized protein n=1 Tax=Meloidogyne floridensis TaxID=298350 RepID=A0A915NED2_9BILA